MIPIATMDSVAAHEGLNPRRSNLLVMESAESLGARMHRPVAAWFPVVDGSRRFPAVVLERGVEEVTASGVRTPESVALGWRDPVPVVLLLHNAFGGPSSSLLCPPE